MLRCLLCHGRLKRRGPSAIHPGSDVYYCEQCPNIYVVSRGHEVEALKRRAAEVGIYPPPETTDQPEPEREPANSAH